MRRSSNIDLPVRAQHEAYVGSSIQFRPKLIGAASFEQLLANCAARGVDIKWFGGDEPKAFTSRYDSWRYLGQPEVLPNTLSVLSRTCDIRVPLTFEPDDCRLVAEIIAEECAQLKEAFALA